MCRAHTHVFYGVPVRAWTLIDAATAWPRLKPVLPFFGLVELRLKHGSLRSDTPSAIERVPLEVWELVKEELVRVDIASTSLAATAFDGCTYDDECCEFCDNLKGTQKPDWKALHLSEMCDMCIEALCGFAENFCPRWSSLVESMVTAFGLSSASSSWLNSTDYVYAYPGSAFYLSASTVAALEADCGGDMGPDEWTVATPTFDVPRDAKARFLRLVRLLQLDPVSVTNLPPSPLAARRKERTPNRRRIEAIALSEVEPRWVVLAKCETTW